MDRAASFAGLHPHNQTEVSGVAIEFHVGFDQVFLKQRFQFVHQILGASGRFMKGEVDRLGFSTENAQHGA